MAPDLALPVIKIEQFEGPFDLLLELARQRQVRVTAVNLSSITESFLNYLKTTPVRPELIADFVVVASTLLLLKLRELLPNLDEAEEEHIQELTDRLTIYQVYRSQAVAWRERWGSRTLRPGPGRLTLPLPRLTRADMHTALQSTLAKIRKPIEPYRHMRPRLITMQECLASFRERLSGVERLLFQDAVRQLEYAGAAVSLLAALEMSRSGEAVLEQSTLFGPLTIRRV